MKTSLSDVDIALVPTAGPLYSATTKLREKILRLPLGLVLSEKDVAGEEQQIHIAALSPEKEVVGTVLLKPLSPTLVKLRQMAVADAYQGSGLGKKLVQFAEQVAVENGFREIEMHARISALGFYEKLGYKVAGDTFIEVTIPTILMKKTLQ
jgi:N-acetylglutamate synthase-like GNAT family acetyltransferase